jgi:hypothetical protein
LTTREVASVVAPASDIKTKSGREQKSLLRKFLPLSLSDVAMALGDPMQTMALARLPNAQATLAGVGIVKAIAVFLESPVIMMLHASTALSKRAESHRALWRFMLALGGLLSLVLLIFLSPPLYRWLLESVFGASESIATIAKAAFALMVVWPFAIAWRRFFQGLLIRFGKSRQVGWASLGRLSWVIFILVIGVVSQWNGALLAGLALAGGVVIEAALVTFFARGLRARLDAEDMPAETLETKALPVDFLGVARFYGPLASTMLLVWGGRAFLVTLVARSSDSALALAAWPAAWGFVLSIANATRMVQQIVIAHEGDTARGDLFRFAVLVGLFCSALLGFLSATPMGHSLLAHMLASKGDLLGAIIPVMQLAIVLPLLVALQNALQGFLIRQQRNWRLNQATVVSVAVSLSLTWFLIRAGIPGAVSAGWGMLAGFVVENLVLATGLERKTLRSKRKDDSNAR